MVKRRPETLDLLNTCLEKSNDIIECAKNFSPILHDKLNNLIQQETSCNRNEVCKDTHEKNALIENTNIALALKLKKSNVANTNLRGIIAELCDKEQNETDKLCIGESSVNPTQNGPEYSTVLGKKRRTMKKKKNKRSVKKNRNKRKGTIKKDLRKKRKSNKKK